MPPKREKKVENAKHSTWRDLEKLCTLNCFKQWGSKGCNIFKRRRQGWDAICHSEGHPKVLRHMNNVLNVSIFNFIKHWHVKILI